MKKGYLEEEEESANNSTQIALTNGAFVVEAPGRTLNLNVQKGKILQAQGKLLSGSDTIMLKICVVCMASQVGCLPAWTFLWETVGHKELQFFQ